MKRIPFINKLLKSKNFSTKVYIYFSYKSAGDDFDPREKNYTYYNLNPVVIKAYVTELTPEKLAWKQIGLQEGGAKEVICDYKYAEWFRKANKIVIDDDEYSCYRRGVGNNATITKRPYNLMRVVLLKK